MAAGFRSLFAFWLGGASAGHQTGGKTQETGGGAAPGAQHYHRQTLARRQHTEAAEAARERAAAEQAAAEQALLRQAEELAAATQRQNAAERRQPPLDAATLDEARETASRFEAPASAAAPDLVQLVIEQLDAARQERVAREQAAADKERSNRNRIAILTALLLTRH